MEAEELAEAAREHFSAPADNQSDASMGLMRSDELMDAGTPWKLRSAAGRGSDAVREVCRAAAATARGYGELAAVMRDLVVKTGAGGEDCLVEALANHASHAVRPTELASMDKVHSRRCATLDPGRWADVAPPWVDAVRSSGAALSAASVVAARAAGEAEGAFVPSRALPVAYSLCYRGMLGEKPGAGAARGPSVVDNLLKAGDAGAFADRSADELACAIHLALFPRKRGQADKGTRLRLADGAAQWLFLAAHSAATDEMEAGSDQTATLSATDPVAEVLAPGRGGGRTKPVGFWMAALALAGRRLPPGTPSLALASILAHSLHAGSLDDQGARDAANIVHRHVRMAAARGRTRARPGGAQPPSKRRRAVATLTGPAGGTVADEDDDDDDDDDDDVDVEEEGEGGAGEEGVVVEKEDVRGGAEGTAGGSSGDGSDRRARGDPAAEEALRLLHLLRVPTVLRLLLRTLFQRSVPARGGEGGGAAGREAAILRQRRAGCAQLLATAGAAWPALGEPRPPRGGDYESLHARVEDASRLLQGSLRDLLASDDPPPPTPPADAAAGAAPAGARPAPAVPADAVAEAAAACPIAFAGALTWVESLSRNVVEAASDRVDACFFELAQALPAVARVLAATSRRHLALRERRAAAFRYLANAAIGQRANPNLRRGGAARIVIDLAVLCDVADGVVRFMEDVFKHKDMLSHAALRHFLHRVLEAAETRHASVALLGVLLRLLISAHAKLHLGKPLPKGAVDDDIPLGREALGKKVKQALSQFYTADHRAVETLRRHPKFESIDKLYQRVKQQYR